MDLENINDNRNRKRRKTPIDLSTMIYGKVPPQAKEIEEQLLGVLMTAAQFASDAFPKLMGEVNIVLNPEDFYVEAHQHIYKAIADLDKTGMAPEVAAVNDKLRSEEKLEMCGGPYYVVKLTNSAVGHTNAVKYARIIKQTSIARRLIEFSGQIISDSFEGGDPFQLLVNAEQLFYEINKEIEETRITTTDMIAFKLMQKILSTEVLTDEQMQEKYLYTGMADWDRVNGPLFRGGVYVIAARPAMGKTAHAVQLLVNMAVRFPVGLINVEMTNEQLAKRIASNIKEINNWLFKKKVEDWTEEERQIFYAAMQDFINMKIHIESDTPDIDRIIQKIKFWVKKYGVRVVIIDYLQILRVADEVSKYMSEVQAMNYILEKIRACAKELDIVIFLLSQLNRELYRRAGNKEPNLADLKGSGKIEEIAFQISFLHRPEYYDDAPVDEMGESTKGLCYQIIAKHRDGELDRIKHRFLPQFTKFIPWTSDISTWKPIDENPF